MKQPLIRLRLEVNPKDNTNILLDWQIRSKAQLFGQGTTNKIDDITTMIKLFILAELRNNGDGERINK